jgi:DNA-directed RNA polymerase specialized sigma24 family protein
MNEILRRYWPGVVDYASRFTPNHDAAKDVAQDTFIMVWQGKLGWASRGSMRAFLYGVSRRLASNRRRAWREVSVDDVGAATPIAGHPGGRTPASQFEE